LFGAQKVRVSVKRTGGYAGIGEILAQVDTDRLATERAARVAALLEACRFFTLPAAMAGAPIGADLFRYEITAEDGPRRHTVSFVDSDRPEVAPLKRLIAALTE
jgi:hypothetical protein